MASGRSIPTVNRISDLPDSIISHIISFLPIKFAATTCILSKRWKLVWLYVLILNFDDKAFNNFATFRKFVYSTMFSLRDKNTSIQSFTLKLGSSCRFQQRELNRILKFVMQRGVKNLNFDMFGRHCYIKLPPRILSCKTLQIIKLVNIKMWDFDQVNFPCLKILHLDSVDFTSPKYFVKFLYGCPILEELNATSHIYQESLVLENLNALPNLVKVRTYYDMDNLMTLVCKAKILHISQIHGMTWKTLPLFHNLTHMLLDSFHSSSRERRDCRSLVEILPHFPNLQYFEIWFKFSNFPGKIICSECLMVPPNPTIAPECLLSQLKSFSIKGYTGRECEFNFVKYIMHHSKVLETMSVRKSTLSTCLEKEQMLIKLSSCTRSSTNCKLIFG
ncbi:F-box/FBD/LRR-repeat protein At4g26340-like [Vicia villosa]|uniref:F-box/FBD/LRR-repeat protein At4g26340-like n=1 Tax=Vicia villosa TaxID=3911 RepID=UPI00273B3F50|nr:F-box/FBD/LRR-repeat protein At4g26340-like [Vicia villosa]